MNRRPLVRSPARPIFFPRIDDSHCDRIHSSLTAIRWFDNGYVGKQPVALGKMTCAGYWLKELQESMDRCTGRRDVSDILLKTTLNTIKLFNQSSTQALPSRVAQWWACRAHVWWLWVWSLVEATVLSGVFRLSYLQKHVRKVVGDFGKNRCVSTCVRKSGYTYASPTAMIWP